jgi:hypothetical protein
MQRHKNNKKQQGKRPRVGRRNFGSINTKYTIAKEIENIVADETDVILDYPQQGVLFAAAPNIAKRWYGNAPYDVDPTVGSTATPGFAEWAAFYSYVRCEKYAVELHVTNLDAKGKSVYLIHTNTDPGTVGTNYELYATAAFGTTRLLSPMGGMDRMVYKRTVPVTRLVGAVDVSTDDSFRSLTNSVPADLVYFGFGIQTVDGGNMATGVGYNLQIRMWCKFYGRKNTLTSFDHTIFNNARLKWQVERERERQAISTNKS